MQGVSGGIENILGGGSMDSSYGLFLVNKFI